MLAMASDFDGTIYFGAREERVSVRDAEAITRFRKAGGLFGVCTGRSYQGVLKAVGNPLKFDFYILVSGALILDRAGRELYKSVLDEVFARELFDFASERGETVVQAGDTVYNMIGPKGMQSYIQSFSEIPKDIYGLSLACYKENIAQKAAAEINERYGDRVTAFCNVTNVDVVPIGCSKGSAVRITKRLIGADRIAGIGDSFNDLPLIREADTGYTFPYAPEEVRAAADHVVDSVAEALALFSSEQR